MDSERELRVSRREEDHAWLALKSEIEKTVSLVTSPLTLGEHDFDWYRVANPERLLELAVEDGKGSAAERDPFWAATWRAAIGLDRFLACLELKDVRVLELGCGSGQAGVAAAMRGALVTLTDVVPLALQVAELNAWGIAPNVEFRKLPWATGKLACPAYPIIIGSDLVYDPQLFPSLQRCAREHLANGGRMYLSEPHRHTGDRFLEWIRQSNWHVECTDVDLQDGRIPIRVFTCWLGEFATS